MRYTSIDFYRGLTIALMLIVNTPGSWSQVYSPLLHADWHGCTPTDLVFPSFLFIIGVSMWFSFEKYGRKLSTTLLLKILRRTAILFGLGLLLAWFPFWGKELDTLRIMGVLQRLGLCYGLASLLVLTLSERWLAAAAIIALLGYWAVLVLFAPPLEDPYALIYNAARLADLSVLGIHHLWQGKGIPFDPEGLLSTMPAIVTVLLGWWAGQMMQRYSADKMRAVRELLGWGNILAICGLVWDMGFPINKSLWTSSFVLYAGGISMILLAFSVWVIDTRPQSKPDEATQADETTAPTPVIVQKNNPVLQFFLVFGANPLVAYVLSGLLVKTMLLIKWDTASAPTNAYKWLYETAFVPINGGKLGSLLFALAFLLICWSICRVLYNRRIFLKV